MIAINESFLEKGQKKLHRKKDEQTFNIDN